MCYLPLANRSYFDPAIILLAIGKFATGRFFKEVAFFFLVIFTGCFNYERLYKTKTKTNKSHFFIAPYFNSNSPDTFGPGSGIYAPLLFAKIKK